VKFKYLILATALWAIAFFPFSLLADDAAPSALTLEEIVTLKRVRSARMRPNGDAIAYSLSVPRRL
jgi:hypothetical protein